jgi:hypothetical protein
MIEKYVSKLIENLPDPAKNNQIIDVIFDGGAFNGSYLVGACYFLKKMEEKFYIKIDRISACSIGAFVSLLYVSDCLDVFSEIYEIVATNFKATHQLNNFKHICKQLESRLPRNVCDLMTKKVYITFYDLKKNKKVVKCKYKSLDDIFDTIYKSCFLPILMDGNLTYKKRYIDGGNPFIFKLNPAKKMEEVIFSDNLTGLYAFCIIQDESAEQYLVLKSLEKFQSNHSVLARFARIGVYGQALKTAQVVCGGEILFLDNQLVSWNLKSGGYSENTRFDERSPLFLEARRSLWLSESNFLPRVAQYAQMSGLKRKKILSSRSQIPRCRQ